MRPRLAGALLHLISIPLLLENTDSKTMKTLDLCCSLKERFRDEVKRSTSESRPHIWQGKDRVRAGAAFQE